MATEGRDTKPSQDTLLGKKYTQLLGYIAELDRLRTPTVSSVDGHVDRIDLSSLPQHKSVIWNTNEAQAFLVVARCSVPESPSCPESLLDWIQYRPNQVDVEPNPRARILQNEQELNWEQEGPVEAWDDWIQVWKLWAEVAKPAIAALDLYTRLYDLHATLKRNLEQVELVAADVAVAFKSVDHPILITPVRIDLDIDRSQITVGCQEEASQVYGDAIRNVLPTASESIARAREEVKQNPAIWAFGDNEVDLFASRFVQGADSEGRLTQGERRRDQLTARRSPWLLLRRRASGLAELADGLIAKYREDGEVPKPIQPVLVDRSDPSHTEPDYRGEPDEDEHAYFTKPANAEQLAILRNFRRNGCVHVQGPPGTGKTHTIANLIGHFLAEGKSVLVTSEKAQALTVLREKVVAELRSLCVSLVGSDANEGFKAGMRGLYESLGGAELKQLRTEDERLTAARNNTIHQLRHARQTMREIIESEHLPIEVRGWRGSPVEAAKYASSRRECQGWIPGEVLADSGPPLTQAEFDELLDLLVHFPREVVTEVRKPLPSGSDVPSPEDFRELMEGLEKQRSIKLPSPAASLPEFRQWEGGPQAAESLLRKIDLSLQLNKSLTPEYRELANRVVETPAVAGMWDSWIRRAEVLLETEQRLVAEGAPYGFMVSGDPNRVLECARLLLLHVQKSGRPVRKPRLLNRDDKLLFASVESRQQFGDEESIKALIHKLEFEEERARFRHEVRLAATYHGLRSMLTEELELKIRRDSALPIALRWVTDHYRPVIAQMPIELRENSDFSRLPDRLVGSGPADRMAWRLEAVIRPSIVRYLQHCKIVDLSQQLNALSTKAKTWQNEDASKPLVALADAVLNRDAKGYAVAFQDVQALRSAAEPIQRRDALLEKLRARAETFARTLEAGNLNMVAIQCTLDLAWTYVHISQELSRRHRLSLQDTTQELDRLKRQLDETTIKLASAKAWTAQHRRVTQPVRSALSRFHEAQKKIGAGQGQRVPEYRRAMRVAMREAKDAFPVWIMPLHDLAKSFDFTNTRFDVVIVDESSQLSALGLITLLIADSAIVVGDDEQTEPSLPGVTMDSVLSLIREHLVDFDDRILWSPDSSLYSFAGRFGATVALREHFRCVPQIISFSSKLCYQGKIQALREAKGVVQLPHVVPINCASQAVNSGRNFNEAEAAEIASLLIACSELPEYEDQTFGVIALRGSTDARGGDPQTDRIVALVRAALGSEEFERFAARSKLKTGTPPAFQGDERDVVFVSMGDDPRAGDKSGPLRLLREGSTEGNHFRKRLNVAVSRARNQVWIVHSFQHYEAELKGGDIRKKLLEFAYAPKEWLESTLAVNPRAESPFEQAVFADLVRLGFKVIPQVPVGQFRIDLVVENADSRVALECDGDAYHQDAAADLARQIVLERCGWRFVRLRGSEYYRNPECAMQRIVHELGRLGVTPSSAQAAQTEPEGALIARVRARVQEIRTNVSAERSIATPATWAVCALSPLPAPMLFASEAENFSSEVDQCAQTPENDAEMVARSLPQLDAVIQSELLAPAPMAMPNWNSRLQPEEYVVFSETGFKDPKTATIAEIQSDLSKIIAIEGPATESTIIDRYRIATGYGRFKGATRELAIAALANAVTNGMVRSRPDYPGADAMIYSLHGQPEMRLRKRGPRELSEIPLGEIVAFAIEHTRVEGSSNEEQALRAILDFFDLKRLTEPARARLRKALELAHSICVSDPLRLKVGANSSEKDSATLFD